MSICRRGGAPSNALYLTIALTGDWEDETLTVSECLSQIDVESEDLFDEILKVLGEEIIYTLVEGDMNLTILDYLEAMRCQLLGISFFRELGGENTAYKNNKPK